MTCKTLMTHLQLGRPNGAVVAVSADLAALFNAAVLGVAACEPMRSSYGETFITAEFIEQYYQELDRELKAAEMQCREALRGRVSDVEWRATSSAGLLCDYLSSQARSADLIVTGIDRDGSFFDGSRHVDIGDLVMQAGRPVLIAPPRIEHLRLDHVMIGWKDTREARRAILDALPFLAAAKRVSIVEIAPEAVLPAAHARIADVVAWLGRHGISALSRAMGSNGDDARQMRRIAHDEDADLIVAGAYGHSRLREWVLGGVTRDFLLQADRCVFVSH